MRPKLEITNSAAYAAPEDPTVDVSACNASSPMPDHWYGSLAERVGRGAATPKARRLADLHGRRRLHEGQFFTPIALAKYIARLLAPTLGAIAARGHKARIIDTSVGSGRLLSWCDPDHHEIAGFDVDTAIVAELASRAEAAGFEHTLSAGRLETMRARGFDIAVINPPFGLHFESPLLEPFHCTSFGSFGPGTSALSHEYALSHALEAASVVVAILPRKFARMVRNDGVWRQRLAALLELPADTFRDEGAKVDTTLCVFDATDVDRAITERRVREFDDAPPVLDLTPGHRRAAKLWHVEQDATAPSITLAVTGSPRVRVVRAGRRILLKFECGFTEARVRNAVLRRRLPPVERGESRRPDGILYRGQGLLDTEVYLTQADPLSAWNSFLAFLRGMDVELDVDPGIAGFLRRRHRRLEAQAVPLQHTVRSDEAGTEEGMEVSTSRHQLLDPMNVRSPLLTPGTQLAVSRLASGYRLEHAGMSVEVDERTLRQRFIVLENAARTTGAWIVRHPGRATRFPMRAADARARIARLGIAEWCGWAYQQEDLVELATVPSSAIVAWEPALGKTRLAAALARLAAGIALVVVEPHVLDQFEEEIASLPLPNGFCRVVRSPADLDTGAKMLLISYNRLRSPICQNAGRRTYARLLRNRVHTLIADEGHRLGRPDSAQSQAVRLVNARYRYALTGTPIQNLPRDALWLATWLAGDGTRAQPYGVHHPFMEPALLHSMLNVSRGVDEFRDRFVSTEWVTNEFKEDMQKGAKREIPVLKNETLFREWLAPLLLRRVKGEPQVAPYFSQKTPATRLIEVGWDSAHLAMYLKTADEFADWYRRAHAEAVERGGHLNLTTVLARIGAVGAAANRPHAPYKTAHAYLPVTSKQRAMVERIDTMVAEGHTVLAFAVSPSLVSRMDRLLRARGHDPVLLHGGISQAVRTRTIRTRVATGAARIILATYGTTKTGLNLPQANRVVLMERGWTPLVEDQAIQRVMRCQQAREVEVECFELAGSLDSYQRQMVEAKRSANGSAIDHVDQDVGLEFLHLDTILGRFVTALAERAGLQVSEWRQQLHVEVA